MYRHAALLLFLSCVFHQSHGVEVRVTDKDGKLCLYASLMANFTVLYEAAGNKNVTAEFGLPGDVTTNGSLCNTSSSTLKLNFGEGHSWSMNFNVSGKTYQADSVVFSYSLKDKKTFPDSVLNDTKTVTVTPSITEIGLDTCYSCKSTDVIGNSVVNQTLWNVLIQAFVSNNSKSDNITSCSADTPITSAPPTTTPTTTPVTNTTSVSPPVTTAPTPTPPIPTVGNYSLKSGGNGSVCLLANFGLRVGVKQGDKYEEMNLNPSGINVNGSCGVNSSELKLESSTMIITFTFTNDSKKFHLQAVNASGSTSSGAKFSESNTSLSLWEAPLSSSYMCTKEQNYTITSNLSLFIFSLQVQPFGVKNDGFSTAHECSMDDIGILIPVIVAAALAGLIVIVVIAYIIGASKSVNQCRLSVRDRGKANQTEECFLDSDLSFLVPIAVGVALSFLIILVLISYLIGRRKSRTGYQSV